MEVWIVEETDGFRLDSIKKMERGFKRQVVRFGEGNGRQYVPYLICI